MPAAPSAPEGGPADPTGRGCRVPQGQVPGRSLSRKKLQTHSSLGAFCCAVRDAVAPRQVTVQDKDLLVAVKDVIREDSRREKCAWTRSQCSTDTKV